MERFNVVGNVMTQLQSATSAVISPQEAKFCGRDVVS